jgi:hypothetical protein
VESVGKGWGDEEGERGDEGEEFIAFQFLVGSINVST